MKSPSFCDDENDPAVADEAKESNEPTNDPKPVNRHSLLHQLQTPINLCTTQNVGRLYLISFRRLVTETLNASSFKIEANLL